MVDPKTTPERSDGKVSQPSWPALLQYAAAPELRVVRDRDEWELDPALHLRPFQGDDRLIDSTGLEYQLVFAPGRKGGGKGHNKTEPTGRRHDPGEVESLAARHIASIGAQPEWLAAHLKEIPEALRIRAVILYLAKLAAAEASSTSDEED